MKKNKRKEDEIWEELRYWLKNPVTAVEQAERDKAEREYIDSVMDRMWGEDSRSLNTSNGPILQGRVEKVANPYELIQQNETLSKEQKAAAIQEIAAQRNREIDKESANKLAKLYGGAALELGSAFVPGTSELKVTQGIAKAIAPKVGRKIAKEISSGMTRGAMSGAVEGVGRGMLEDKNPIKTAVQDSATGLAGGALAGAVGGNVQKMIKGKNLEKINNLKTLRKAETNYYKDYLQGTTITRKDLGKINFTQSGLETVSKDPNAGRSFSKLKNALKNANYEGYEKPYHEKHGQKDNILGFHKLSNNDNNYLLSDTTDGLKYYLSKQKNESSIRPSRVGLDSSNNIITNQSPKLNSIQEWLEELKRRRRR